MGPLAFPKHRKHANPDLQRVLSAQLKSPALPCGRLVELYPAPGRVGADGALRSLGQCTPPFLRLTRSRLLILSLLSPPHWCPAMSGPLFWVHPSCPAAVTKVQL